MKNNKSFTLVETLAVITIIGILSGFLILRFQESNYEAELSRAKAFSLSVLMSLPVETVSEWKFDGPTTAGSSATLDDAKDTWGANDGTVYGTPVVKDGNDCISGKCLSFNGTNSYVSLGNNESLNQLNAITVSGWFNLIDNDDYQRLVNNADVAAGTPQIGYELILYNNDTMNFLTKGDVASRTLSYSFSNFDKWVHIVGTYNGLNNKLYENGVLKNSNNLNAGNFKNNNILYIGTRQSHTAQFFNGRMDEIRIFNAALTVSQINQMYLAGLDSLYLSNQIPKEEYNQRLSELKMNLTKHE